MSEEDISWVLSGNCEGAHSVIATNLQGNLPAEIARRTDLPGSLPSELGSDPLVALGCFALDQKQVIYEIAQDLDAPRSGMARSGAVVINAVEAAAAEDPVRLIAAARSVRLSGTPVVDGLEVTSEPARPCAPLLEGLAAGKVVVPLHQDPAMVLRSLWATMPATMRPRIYAGLCFSPDDLPDEGVIAVGFMPGVLRWTCPESMWVDDPFGSADDSVEPFLADLATGGGARLGTFAEENGFAPSTIQDLRLIHHIEKLTQPAAKTSNLIRALRFSLSVPRHRETSPFLGYAVEAIAGLQPSWSVEDVLSMRNLAIDQEAGGMSSALSHWVADSLSEEEGCNTFLCVVEHIWDERCAQWWRESVRKGLSGFSGSIPEAMARYVWIQAIKDPRRAKSILLELAKTTDLDERLANALGAVTEVKYDLIREVAPPKDFPRSNAKVLLAGEFSAHEAVARVSAVEHIDVQTSVAEAVGELAPAGMVHALVVADREGVLLVPLAKRLVKEPAAFDGVSMQCVPMQRVLAAGLEMPPRKPQSALGKMVFRAFDVLLDIGSLDDDLLDSIETNEGIHALDYARRADLWPALRASTQQRLLERTAAAWFERFDNVRAEALEAPFLTTLSSQPFEAERVRRLANADLNSWILLAGLEKGSGYELRSRLLQIVGGSSNLDPAEVARMSMIVRDRYWSDVASSLVRSHHNRKDLKPAWPLLQSMLNFFEKILLPGTTFTASDWDQALEQILADLYVEGPTEEQIWERAGGRLSEITGPRTGFQRWRAAIRQISKGGQVTRHALVREALRDHPHNRSLRALQDRLP